MITPRIKALFQFIDFLHSNIENFNQYENEINELRLLGEEREKVYKKKNFAEKQKYDRIQLQIGGKVEVIQNNIVQPIRDKANELSICSPEADKTETLWNWNSAEIIGLKEKVSDEDLPEIFNHKNKYIEYRTKTKVCMLYGLPLFFDNLDEVLKELFSYFNETEQNEFEAFETKEIFSNSITEALELLKQGYKVVAPLNLYNPLKEQQRSNTEPLPPRTDTKPQPELKIKQIALKYFYEGLQITRENGNEIAKKYGHTSGEKLFQQFTFYSSTANRKAKPDLCTAKKLKNKIELIESVIELLPFDKQARAKDEVSILNKLYEAEYQ